MEERKRKERTLRASFAKKSRLKESRIIMGVLKHKGEQFNK
jgi:RNA:NAD 2'-phosphotransferase (TPT1/KptA family)